MKLVCTAPKVLSFENSKCFKMLGTHLHFSFLLLLWKKIKKNFYFNSNNNCVGLQASIHVSEVVGRLFWEAGKLSGVHPWKRGNEIDMVIRFNENYGTAQQNRRSSTLFYFSSFRFNNTRFQFCWLFNPKSSRIPGVEYRIWHCLR
jgi:hypothetical protein